jgi:flagellar hook-associated protein 3 FlgL
MSGSIGSAGAANCGMMDSLVSHAAAVRQKLNTLTDQVSSGRTADSFAGLGGGAEISLNLGPQIANAKTWHANIAAAMGNIALTQTAMSRIQQIANDFFGKLPNLNNSPSSEIDSIAVQARSALQLVANLLDTRNGDTYVFAGADSANAPVPNPDNILSSGFYTQINTAVAGLAGAGAAATVAATLGIAASNAAGTSPFSAYQSQPAATLQPQIPAVQAGGSQRVPVGLLASANASVTSSGSSTTGSYMRDLLRGLATIGSLTGSQGGLAGFQGVVSDTTASLGGAISAMASDAGNLGSTQASLAATQTSLSDTVTALSAQVSSVQDVDMAATLSQLQLVQTQMQSSYQLIASYSSLSLVKFLPAG